MTMVVKVIPKHKGAAISWSSPGLNLHDWRQGFMFEVRKFHDFSMNTKCGGVVVVIFSFSMEFFFHGKKPMVYILHGWLFPTVFFG